MRKYVLIPDSFKGTLSSREVCQIVAEAIRSHEPEAEICAIPVADGGEGTVDAFLSAVGGQQVPVACTGPYGEAITACYGLLPDGSAVVEMAAAAGLPMVGENRDPEKTTTYGVGQLIRHAAHHGAKRLVLALGGSATNDGGCGAAAAVGVKFYRATGESFVPVGGTLKDIHRIDTSGMDPAVRSIPILTMCDIDNPLCGPTGASAVFGPQKGADAAMVRRLDDGLRHLAALLERDVGRDVLNLPGGGAAGGFGTGAAAFFASPLQMGIDVVLALTDFDRRAADAALARAVWTARACGARWWWAWPAAPRRWAFPWRRWWAAATRTWPPCTARASAACSPSIPCPSPSARSGRTAGKICALPPKTSCGSTVRYGDEVWHFRQNTGKQRAAAPTGCRLSHTLV